MRVVKTTRNSMHVVHVRFEFTFKKKTPTIIYYTIKGRHIMWRTFIALDKIRKRHSVSLSLFLSSYWRTSEQWKKAPGKWYWFVWNLFHTSIYHHRDTISTCLFKIFIESIPLCICQMIIQNERENIINFICNFARNAW